MLMLDLLAGGCGAVRGVQDVRITHRQHTTRTPTTEATTRLPQRATPTANRVEAAHAHHEGRGSYRGRRDREVDRQFFLTS